MNALEKERTRHHISIKAANDGLKAAFITQPNFLYHAFFSLVAICLSFLLKISTSEFLTILTLILFGFVIEMANTAVESVVDLVTSSWHRDAKRAKDVAAGMMLLYAYGATAIAAIIFVPYFLVLLRRGI